MKRSAPMKRTPFKAKGLPPPRPAKQMDSYTVRPRPVAVPAVAANASTFKPQPKDEPLQHQGYMALVRGLNCARCGIYRPRLIQFCHADVTGYGGKALGLKSDCRLGWPGCGPHDGQPGCHWIVGTSGTLPKAERRAFEAQAGTETRATIFNAGTWPARLPRWPADLIETPCNP